MTIKTGFFFLLALVAPAFAGCGGSAVSECLEIAAVLANPIPPDGFESPAAEDQIVIVSNACADAIEPDDAVLRWTYPGPAVTQHGAAKFTAPIEPGYTAVYPGRDTLVPLGVPIDDRGAGVGLFAPGASSPDHFVVYGAGNADALTDASGAVATPDIGAPESGSWVVSTGGAWSFGAPPDAIDGALESADVISWGQ